MSNRPRCRSRPTSATSIITVNVFEGEKYTVSEVKLDGQMLVPRAELEKLIRVKPGEVFSRQRLTETNKAITDRLGNDGYAFANASAVPQIDKEKRTVAFTIIVDPGRRVYVRRINVAGNTKTRDEVVRREMRQLEGAYYDASKIQLSKTRIDRTQYFKDVNVETVPVPESADQVDVNYTVEEKPTGSLLLGAGYSSVDKVVVSGAVTQSNIFGSGKFLGVQVSSGTVNRTYSLSYLDPYFTIDGVSQGFDLYTRKIDASTLAVGPYTTDTIGAGFKFGYPLSETDAVSFGIVAENVKLGLFDATSATPSPQAYLNFASIFGTKYTYGSGTVGWARERRNSVILPTSGTLTRAAVELAGGDLQYYRLSATEQFYYPLSRTVTLALNGEVGYVAGTRRQAGAVLQELLRRRPRIGARLQGLLAGRAGFRRQRARRNPQGHRQRGSSFPGAGRPAGQEPAAGRVPRWRPGIQLGSDRAGERIGRRAAFLHRSRPRMEFSLRSPENFLCPAA